MNNAFSSANTLAAHGRYDEAIAKYRIALRQNSHNGQIHHMYGRTLALMGYFGDAVQQYSQAAVLLAEPSAALEYDWGVAYAAGGENEEGVRHLLRAVNISPRFIAAYNNLGIALGRLGDYSGAIAAYEASLQLQPTNSIIANKLADLRGVLNGTIKPHIEQVAPAPPSRLTVERVDLPAVTDGAGGAKNQPKTSAQAEIEETVKKVSGTVVVLEDEDKLNKPAPVTMKETLARKAMTDGAHPLLSDGSDLPKSKKGSHGSRRMLTAGESIVIPLIAEPDSEKSNKSGSMRFMPVTETAKMGQGRKSREASDTASNRASQNSTATGTLGSGSAGSPSATGLNSVPAVPASASTNTNASASTGGATGTSAAAASQSGSIAAPTQSSASTPDATGGISDQLHDPAYSQLEKNLAEPAQGDGSIHSGDAGVAESNEHKEAPKEESKDTKEYKPSRQVIDLEDLKELKELKKN